MQNPSEIALKYAQACKSLQHFSTAEVLAQFPVVLSTLLPDSQFQLEEHAPITTGWQDAKTHRGYLSAPPKPLCYQIGLSQPLGEEEKNWFEGLLRHFELCVQVAAFQEELDRQARRDWLTGLPHRFQLYRQLDAYGRLLSSYHVGLLEVADLSEGLQQPQAFYDHLLLQVSGVLRNCTLHAYRFDNGRFIFILDQEQKETLPVQLAEFPELKARLSWADTREGTPESIVNALISRLQLA